jgi:hypothetical protein
MPRGPEEVPLIMPNAIRLFVFAAIVAIIALTLAPPVGTSAGITAAPSQASAVPTAPADLSGTYVGTITPDVPGELPDSGMIIIRREGETLVVTAGPGIEMQYPSQKVMRTPGGLTFEIEVAGEDATRVLQFDLKVDGAQMSGSIAMLRDGTRASGRLAFTRQ